MSWSCVCSVWKHSAHQCTQVSHVCWNAFWRRSMMFVPLNIFKCCAWSCKAPTCQPLRLSKREYNAGIALQLRVLSRHFVLLNVSIGLDLIQLTSDSSDCRWSEIVLKYIEIHWNTINAVFLIASLWRGDGCSQASVDSVDALPSNQQFASILCHLWFFHGNFYDNSWQCQ